MFNKHDTKHGIEERSTRGTFWLKDANTIKKYSGEKDTSVENFFNKNIENPAAPLIEEFANTDDPCRFLSSKENREALTVFAYAQIRRSPSTDKLLSDERYQELLHGARQEALERLGRKPTGAERALFESKTDDLLIRNAQIASRKLGGIALDRLTNSCGIAVAEATQGASFLLGDEAVLRFGGELGSDGAEVVLPMSPTRSVIWCAKKYDGDHYRLEKRLVRYGNTFVWKQSNVVASPSKALISSFRKEFGV